MDNNVKIDVSSLLVIINKLKLYKEENQVLVDNIKKTLSKLEKDYISKNNVIIKDKNKSICLLLDRLFDEKEMNIKYLEDKIRDYSELDYKEYIKYYNLVNDIKED